MVVLAESGFSASRLSLINGTVIDSGRTPVPGDTTGDFTADVKNRSDVWGISDRLGLRLDRRCPQTATCPKASAALQISPDDDIVQALDTCVST